jgi:hypothetical protein
MKTLLTLFAISTLLGGNLTAAAAPTTQSPTPHHSTTAGCFEKFRKKTDASNVLADAQVKQAIKRVMGSDVESFYDNAQLIDEPDQIKGNELLITAGVRGLFTEMESALSLNLSSGTAVVGVLADGVEHIYGAANESKIPPLLKDYVNNLRTRRGNLSLSFDKPGIKKTVAAKKAPLHKPFDQSTLTGTYERIDVDRFNAATLDIKQLAPDKIKFSISAANGGHTGEDEGEITLKNRSAVYKNDDGNYSLTFEFGKDKVEVSKSGSGDFGGVGVFADGTYARTSDKSPKME